MGRKSQEKRQSQIARCGSGEVRPIGRARIRRKGSQTARSGGMSPDRARRDFSDKLTVSPIFLHFLFIFNLTFSHSSIKPQLPKTSNHHISLKSPPNSTILSSKSSSHHPLQPIPNQFQFSPIPTKSPNSPKNLKNPQKNQIFINGKPTTKEMHKGTKKSA